MMRRGRNATGRTAGMLAVLLTLVAGAALPAFAGRQRWEISSSLTYVTGDYGTPTESDLVYMPVTVDRNFSRGKAALTVPWLWIDRSTDVVIIGGVPQGGNGGIDGSESGLGDIVLEGDYYLSYPDTDGWLPGIDLTVDLKLPTADENDGLGTGELDVGVGIGVYRWFLKSWIAFADIEYNFIGEPSGRDFDNQIIYDIGISHETTDKWINTLLLEERTAIAQNADDSVSLVYAAAYEFRENIEGFASLEWGLSDGAPDYSLTVGAEYGF